MSKQNFHDGLDNDALQAITAMCANLDRSSAPSDTKTTARDLVDAVSRSNRYQNPPAGVPKTLPTIVQQLNPVPAPQLVPIQVEAGDQLTFDFSPPNSSQLLNMIQSNTEDIKVIKGNIKAIRESLDLIIQTLNIE